MKQISVRTKLFILIVMVMTPLFGLQAIRIHRDHDRWIQRELQASQDFVGVLSRTFMTHVEKIWYAELIMGKALISLQGDRLEQYMVNLEGEQKNVRGSFWIDAHGQVVASTIPGLRDADWHESDWFKRIEQGEERVVGNAIWSGQLLRFMIPVARAIREGETLCGIVVGFLDPWQLGRIIPEKRSRETSCIGLVDREGNMVYRSGKHENPEKKQKICADSQVWEALKTGEVVISDKWPSEQPDEQRVGINYPVKEIGWVCFVTVSVDEILVEYRKDISRHLIVLLVIIVGSVILAGLLARWITLPVESLKVAAEAISAGNLTYRTEIRGNDELAAAGQAFDIMAGRIEQLESDRRLFLQTSAHELKNPMASIKGLVGLLRRRIDSGQMSDKIRPLLEVLDKEIDRLSMVLNQILDAFKTQEGKLACRFEQINLIDVIRSAMSAIQLADEEREVTLESSVDTIWVSGDFLRLEDVMRNLLGNAKKYSPAKSSIKVVVSIDSLYVIVAVIDQGIGIPPEELQHIFEGFVRGTNLSGKDPGGMGLGLYICRDIILRHGGEIWAQNNEEQGSTFFVRLPRVGRGDQ